MTKSPPNLLVFDDEEFGDFDFAAPNASNSTTMTTTAAVVKGFDEDEWGDFVENTDGSKNGNTIDNSVVVVKEKVWEKPSGAIPLSIFGEKEGEEDVNDADLESSINSNGKNSIFGLNKVNVERNGVGSHGIKDLIFGLYSQDEHNSSNRSGSKDDVGGEVGFDVDDGGGGWEFRNAESSGFDGDADRIQAVENGVEHDQAQSFPSETNDNKKYNGVLHDVSQPFTRDITQSDSLFTLTNESKHIINLEKGSTPNLANGGISTTLPIPSDDIFFHSSLTPVKSELPVLGLNGGGSNDLLSDLYRPSSNKHDDDNVGYTGNYSNGVVPYLWANNEKDNGFDDDNWEFKDAPSDVLNGHMAQDKDVLKSVADIHEKSSLPGHSNKKDMFGTHLQYDTFTEVPVLFVGDVSNTSSHQDSEDIKTVNGISPSKDLFVSSAPPLKGSSKLGSGNIMDLFDDFYGVSNKHGGADKAGNLNDAINTGAGFSHFTNNDLDDNSWEFKDAHSDICNRESNSHQDQDFGKFWDNHMEKSSTSTVQIDKQELNGILNTHDEYFSDPPSKIVEAKNLPGFGQFGDLLFDGAEDGHSSSNGFTNFNIPNSEDKSCNNYDDLKSTSFNNGVKDQSYGTMDGHGLKVVTKLLIEDFVDFYSTLKDASQLLVLRHLDDLKKTHEIAVLCHEDDKAMGLDQEIQRAHAKLEGEVNFSDNNLTKECLSNDDFVKDLLETTQKPFFTALEMEYSLSEKISLAKKSLAPAIDLFKHAISILHLLNSTPGEEQRAYIIAWSKILSACARELHHGSMIWAQCHQANLCKQILSNTQGFHYFLALGEIYIVVKVLSVSLTIYKPWLLLNPVDSEDLWNSMNKCFNFWVNSGLETDFEKMDLADSNKNKARVKSLLESVDLIDNLDIPTLQNHVSGHGDSLCRLSLLPLGKLQEMKTVVWGGERYFVKLANLWANRISCDPPSLHHMNVG